ncbi:hypothetical protein HAX54_010494, partial [Datura stramonium]|nr:hypothetical protein [Datura stramonium]
NPVIFGVLPSSRPPQQVLFSAIADPPRWFLTRCSESTAMGYLSLQRNLPNTTHISSTRIPLFTKNSQKIPIMPVKIPIVINPAIFTLDNTIGKKK